jgi:two-component sensor histidine kinase
MDGSRDVKQAAGDLQVVEIRHRLANCFQLLTGLIQFRLTQASDGESKRQLAGLQDAVASLGLLQQRLAAADSDGFCDYLAEATDLWRHLTSDRGISIVLETEDIGVSADKATPLALILHELLTNCCEHAFPNRVGIIRVFFRIQERGVAELMVIDDGVGLPSERPARQSFGLSVVNRLANQLGGTFSMANNSPGVAARVAFPLRN